MLLVLRGAAARGVAMEYLEPGDSDVFGREEDYMAVFFYPVVELQAIPERVVRTWLGAVGRQRQRIRVEDREERGGEDEQNFLSTS